MQGGYPQFIGQTDDLHERRIRPIYLEGDSAYYQKYSERKITPIKLENIKQESIKNGAVYNSLRPMIFLMQLTGIFPLGSAVSGVFRINIPLAIYSCVIFIVSVAYVGYINWDKVEMVTSAEGKFEEAVIDYLFTVYLLPVVLIPITWFESRRMGSVFTDWVSFEKFYTKVSGKRLAVFQGNKPLLTTLALPVIACGTMVVTHVTMAHFRVLQVCKKIIFWSREDWKILFFLLREGLKKPYFVAWT